MLNELKPLLNKYIPAAFAIKGVEKKDPRIKKFISMATKAGYGTEAILDFIRDKFESSGTKQERSRLQARSGTGTLRPDELGALEKQRSSDRLTTGVAGVAGLGAGLKSALQPEEVEVKEEVEQPKPSSIVESSPEHKKIFTSGQTRPEEEEKIEDVRSEKGNIIEMKYPKLHEEILGLISSGNDENSILGFYQKFPDRFGKEIKEIEKKTGSKFNDLIRQFYLKNKQVKKQEPQEAEQQSKSDPLVEAIKAYTALRKGK